MRSLGWVVAFGFASALSLQGRLDIPGKGVISDAEKTGAVRIDRTGEVHELLGSNYRQQPFAIAPDVGRMFTAEGLTVTEKPLVQGQGYKGGSFSVSGPGKIMAMEVHPGGDRLIVVVERPFNYVYPGYYLTHGVTAPPGAYDANLDRDRVSVFSINIADPIGVPRNRSVLQSVTLDGVAFNV